MVLQYQTLSRTALIQVKRNYAVKADLSHLYVGYKVHSLAVAARMRASYAALLIASLVITAAQRVP